MLLPSKRIFFENYIFEVWKDVYDPAEDSFLFAESLIVNQDDYVLDMGTGCGILGIVAAAKVDRVVAIDINPYAVRCAKENAKLNHVAEKMCFLRGHLFGPLKVDEEFDLILFNAPYVAMEPEARFSWLEQAWNGGTTGRRVIERFICKASKYLRQSGRILLLQSTLANVDETLKSFWEKGLKAYVVIEQDLPFFESVVLIEAKF